MEQPDRLTAPALHPFPLLKVPQPEIVAIGEHCMLKSINSDELSVNRLTVSFGYGLNNAPNPAAKLLADTLIKEGTLHRSGFEISELFDFNGAWFRYDSQQYSTLFALWSMTDSTLKLLPTFCELLSEPAFPQDEFEAIREKLAANAEIELRKVATRASIELHRRLFGPEHPKGTFLTPDVYRNVSRDDIMSEFRRMKEAARCNIYLAGAVKPIQLEIIKTFESNPPVNGVVDYPNAVAAAPQPGFYKVDVPDTTQSAVRIAIPTIPRSHPDYVDLRIAVTALGGYFGSRLMTNIREHKGYTYDIHSSLCADRDCSYVDINCQADPRYIDDLLAETFREIERLASEPMSDEELAVVKSNYTTGLLSTLDSPFTAMDYYISADNCGIPQSYFEDQIRSINCVTAECIRDVFARHIDSTQAITVVAGR